MPGPTVAHCGPLVDPISDRFLVELILLGVQENARRDVNLNAPTVFEADDPDEPLARGRLYFREMSNFIGEVIRERLVRPRFLGLVFEEKLDVLAVNVRS